MFNEITKEIYPRDYSLSDVFESGFSLMWTFFDCEYLAKPLLDKCETPLDKYILEEICKRIACWVITNCSLQVFGNSE